MTRRVAKDGADCNVYPGHARSGEYWEIAVQGAEGDIHGMGRGDVAIGSALVDADLTVKSGATHSS